MPKTEISIFWFRRDLRLEDNTALFHALSGSKPVLPIFIFDTQILDRLQHKSDRRVQFLVDEINRLQQELQPLGSQIQILHGEPLVQLKQLAGAFSIESIYCNHDYEPYARKRDDSVRAWCTEQGIDFLTYKDQVVFERNEVVKGNGEPFLVFTPYSKKWLQHFEQSPPSQFASEKLLTNLLQVDEVKSLTVEDIGFLPATYDVPERDLNKAIPGRYSELRDIPAKKGTSRLSVHLRFGTISIRELAVLAQKKDSKFLSELIWREFYMMVLYHFPRSVHNAIKPKYDRIEWENNEDQFKQWCAGKTGIPIVDAGMRQLNETGYMHNRVRMIVASFLTKNLLIDWRWGEAYFAEKLLDYEQSSNVGGWQWAAGCGLDAAPYFRVFNPVTQQQKFDPQMTYCKRWIPELSIGKYVQPIVDLKFTRVRALDRYKKALSAE